MRIPPTSRIVLFLCVALFLCYTPLFSQNLQKKISLETKNRTIPEVLKMISASSGVEFSYNPQLFSTGMVISLRVEGQTVEQVLNEVLVQHGYAYQVVENHLVLRRMGKQELKQGNPAPPSSHRYTLSGYLRDKNSGEVLIGANVHVKGSYTGVTTNGYGFYSLTLDAGKYPVSYSYVGYKEVLQMIDLMEDIKFSMDMEEEKTEIREVEIVASQQENDLRRNQMSEFSFTSRTLAQLPGFGGDFDIIRALQAVPGIQTFGDGSALYYVRGGNFDQNLLLIDEVPVYNPSHLFGFFSAFSPAAINTVQVFKGDFPAKFGGRLSSVIDIKAREGNMKRFGFSGNIGPYASEFTVEGPIVKEKASFFISGRLSTLNWLGNLPSFNNTLDFQFFDINAKLNYRLNDNNRFFITVYGGRDDLRRYLTVEVNSFGINWDNLAGTVRWNHLFTNRLFSNTTINYSRYQYSLNLPQEQNGYWTSAISNLTLKTDLTWYLNPANTLRCGLEVTSHSSNPGNVTVSEGTTSKNIPVVARYNAMEYLLYLSNEQQIGSRLSLRYGVRLPVWQDLGATDVYYFDANHQVIDTIRYNTNKVYYTRFSPEPRINIRYQFNEKSFLKASYSRTTQFLQLVSNSTSPFTSLEVWVPAGPNIPPQTADQVAVGYSREFQKPKFTVSVEGYYKWFHDHPDYRDHANLLFNTLIEGELRFGKAWSYGVEFLVRKTTGRFTGWIGYTWSRAMIQTPEINGGKTYPATYDRPHDLSVNLAWEDKKHWMFTASWIYMTGGATTIPVGFYYVNGYSVPVYGDKNNDRLPDYHRLDLSAKYIFNKPGNRYQHSLSLTLYNAYGRLNPFSVNFNKMMNDQGDFLVPSDKNGTYDLVPTTISVAGIIPSINYQFKF